MYEPVYEMVYNAVLVGSAVLCVARGVLGRSERVAWTVSAWPRAVGERQPLLAVQLSDLRGGAVPVCGRRFWLGFLPVCYLGVLLLARKRCGSWIPGCGWTA